MAPPQIQPKIAAGGTMDSGTSNTLTVSPPATGRYLDQTILNLADRLRKPFFIAILIAYILGFNGQWRMGPDSGLYLNLARNLATGNGYTYHGIRHETVYPGFPIALAAMQRLFPNHLIVADDLFILACAIAALALTYRLILLAYDRPTAIVITVGVAFTHEFFRYSYEILTDMPFLTGVMAVLAGHEAIFGSATRRPKWWDWAILLAGLVIVVCTRPTMIGLLAAWIIALVFSPVARRNWRAAIVPAIMCIVTVALFLFLDPRRLPGHAPTGNYEQYAFRQLTHDLPDELRNNAVGNLSDLLQVTGARAVFGMDLGYTSLNVIFGGIAFLAGVALIRRKPFWGLWVLITLLTLILLISNYRYILQMLPLLVVGWWNLLRSINHRLPRRIGNAVFAILLVLGTCLNIGQVVAFIVHQHAHPFLADYENGEFQPYVKIAEQIPAVTTSEDVILCPPKLARIMTFLAGRDFSEPNEPIAAAPGHLFVILDPKSPDYARWLAARNVSPQGDPLASATRARNVPPITLMRALISPAAK
ncbi:MAG TPA: glycosyltransferase family 39 protein [Tepidisphaeraceae bacterium]|jgi:hypothetical protein